MNLRFVRGSAFLAACLAFSVLATAACGAAAITKPLTAAQILQNSQQSNLKDTSFDLKFDIVASGTTLSFTGNGKLTKSPARSDIHMEGSFLGQSITIDTITADGYDYTKTTPSKTTKYVKMAAGSSSSLGVGSSSFTNFGDLKNPTLIGTETVAGHSCFHLRGTIADSTPVAGTSTSTPSTEDLWVQTDTFYPAKVMLSETSSIAGQTSTVSFTLTFTSWNTGLTISVPPANDVVNG